MEDSLSYEINGREATLMPETSMDAVQHKGRFVTGQELAIRLRPISQSSACVSAPGLGVRASLTAPAHPEIMSIPGVVLETENIDGDVPRTPARPQTKTPLGYPIRCFDQSDAASQGNNSTDAYQENNAPILWQKLPQYVRLLQGSLGLKPFRLTFYNLR